MRRALAALLALAATTPAFAIGGRIDVYAGDATADGASITLEQHSLFGGVTTASSNVPAGIDEEIGVRALAWGDDAPWLVGLDLAYLHADNGQVKLRTVPVTLAAGLRAPRPLWPHAGRGLTPYALAGISAVTVNGHADVGGIDTDIQSGHDIVSSSGGDATFAPFLAAGVGWQLSSRIGLFAEYRVRHYRYDSLSTNSLVLPTENVYADGDFRANALVFGISWHIDSPVGRPVPASPFPAPGDDAP